MEPARLTTEAADLRESVLPHQLIPAVPNRIFKVNPDPAQCETKSFITVTLLFNQVDRSERGHRLVLQPTRRPVLRQNW